MIQAAVAVTAAWALPAAHAAVLATTQSTRVDATLTHRHMTSPPIMATAATTTRCVRYWHTRSTPRSRGTPHPRRSRSRSRSRARGNSSSKSRQHAAAPWLGVTAAGTT